MVKPTLGVYGPKAPERAGGADYIALSLPALSNYFDCTHVSNRDWCDPSSFDYVLYHLGNNHFHHCAFQALQVRHGPAIIHEHNCLLYYFHRWDEGTLPQEDEAHLLQLFSQHYNIPFLNKAMVYSFLTENGSKNYYEHYVSDIHVEELFINCVTVAFIHSPSSQNLLQRRYPDLCVVYLPHMATPFDQTAIKNARHFLKLRADDYLFGSYGFISRVKRLDKVLEAWSQWKMKPSNVKLLILGENSWSLEIPQLSDLIYLGYVEDIREFDAFLGASNCAIQLRYPSVGETSGVMTKVIANGKLLITSDTDALRGYQERENVIFVKADEHEIESLIQAFHEALRHQSSPQFDERYSPQACARKLYEGILNG